MKKVSENYRKKFQALQARLQQDAALRYMQMGRGVPQFGGIGPPPHPPVSAPQTGHPIGIPHFDMSAALAAASVQDPATMQRLQMEMLMVCFSKKAPLVPEEKDKETLHFPISCYSLVSNYKKKMKS